MRFPAEKNAGCPKAPRDFRQEKMAFSIPRRVVLRLLSPSPRVCTGGRTDERTLTSQTKISRIDRLPNFLSNGAPLARSAIIITMDDEKCDIHQCLSFIFYFISFAKGVGRDTATAEANYSGPAGLSSK